MKNDKKKKKVKLIYKIVINLLFLVSIIFIVGLMLLNVLTINLFMLVVGILLFIDFLFWIFIIKSKNKKISSFCAVFLVVILNIGSFYLFKTNDFFGNVVSHYKTYNYSVVVLDDSDYDNIDDIDGVSMGYLDNDSLEVKKSIEYINDKVVVDYVKYSDTNEIVLGLLKNKVESIFIEDSYYEMIKEEDEDFASNSRVIYTFKIRVKIDDFSKDVNVTKEVFNIFISGIDTYGTVDSVSRSDVNMLVTINPKTKQVLMTSIPRDYYVSLHGVSGYKDKLTHAGLYGVDMSVKTVEDLFNIEINYYVKVNFTSVINIVEALDGVEVYSDYTFTSVDGYNYNKGYNKVNGEEALSFARERKAFAAGDNQRVKNQQALFQAIFKKCISKDIIYKYNKLLNSLGNSFVTNMGQDRITSLIKMQLKDMADWTITSNRLTGANSSNYTYSCATQKLYVMEPDEESVDKAYDLIMSVYNGDILENSYDEKTGESHIVTKSSSSNSAVNNDKSNIVENNSVVAPKDIDSSSEVVESKEDSSEVNNSDSGDIVIDTDNEDRTDINDGAQGDDLEVEEDIDNMEDNS